MSNSNLVSAASRPLAYSYLRLSSERQLKGDGLRRQMESSALYCEKQGFTLDTTWKDLGVSAFSGANRERGALREFLDHVRSGKIPGGSHLIIESLDRLSRDKVRKALPIFIEIINSGITVHTLVDGRVLNASSIDDNAFEIMQSIMSFVRANEESATKSRRLSAAWEKKRRDAAAGTRKVSCRCPGWLKARKNGKGEIKFSKIPERVKMVQDAYKWLAEGLGVDLIARRFNRAGLPSWGKGTGEWFGGSVYKVLFSTDAVLGRFQPCKMVEYEEAGERKTRRVPDGDQIEGYFPAVVSDEAWVKAKAAQNRRSMVKPSNAGGRKGTVYTNLFSKLATCGCCGRRMGIRHGAPRTKIKIALQCTGVHKGTCSNVHRIDYNALEADFIRWVTELVITRDEHRDTSDLDTRIAALQVQDATISSKINKLMDRLEDAEDGSEVADIRVRMQARRSEIGDVRSALSKLEVERRAMTLAPKAKDRVEEVAALNARLSDPSNDRFAIRASIAGNIHDLVGEMTVSRERVFVRLRTGEVYAFTQSGALIEPVQHFDKVKVQPGAGRGASWAHVELGLPMDTEPATISSVSSLLDLHADLQSHLTVSSLPSPN